MALSLISLPPSLPLTLSPSHSDLCQVAAIDVLRVLQSGVLGDGPGLHLFSLAVELAGKMFQPL